MLIFMTTQDSVDYHTELFNRVSYYFLALVFSLLLAGTQFTWNSAVELAQGVGGMALIDH